MTTINELTQMDTIDGGDQIPIYSTNNGTTRKIAFSTISKAILNNVNNNFVTQYSAPASGFTVNINDTSLNIWLVITPLGALATGTIKLPTMTNCVMGQEMLISSTQAITALTINANGANIVGAPVTLLAGAFFRLKFESVTGTWYRVG